MTTPAFRPGFRLSGLDCLILAAGSVGACAAWQSTWWQGFVIAFVVCHFFLFCNVFRIARVLELIWAGVFALLLICTVKLGKPGWPATIIVSSITTAAAVTVEMLKPSYHGVGWKLINPPWWDSQFQK